MCRRVAPPFCIYCHVPRLGLVASLALVSSRIRPCRRRAAARARRALYGGSRPAFRMAVHPGRLFMPSGSRVKGFGTKKSGPKP
jgi:hypothetical protein